ncbi:MAG TPA: histidine phosphatase family protein [Bacteroidetes bacterium]|nr:histidine phosphatase family protein [Bacteroidota bacterium]
MKTIVLGRHAKSDWSAGMQDFDRPLNRRGEKDAPRMGKLLADYGIQPDIIISSPANRAQTTAQHIGNALNYTAPIQLEQRIYEEGHGTILSILEDLPSEASSVMLFGHNPTMEHIISYLLQMRAGITMPTCGMVCLEASINDWKQLNPLSISLKWFLIPRLI